MASAVSAKLLCHRYPGIVRMLEGFWLSLRNLQVAFVDKHEGPEARTGRATAVIAMAIKGAYQIAPDLVSDRSAQAAAGKFCHYL
jgi:hypothetical protein